MKELLANNKKYNFWDFLRIPFTVCPVYAGIKVLNQVVVSLLPSLQVLATAAFIDSALDIFAGKAEQAAIRIPLLCLILIVAYNKPELAADELCQSENRDAPEFRIPERNRPKEGGAQLKSFFSMVYQDFARYQISMEDNIALGDVLHRDRDAIMTAAEAIGLGPVIEGLPQGMETPLGKIKEKGVDLSGGQWQRVAIARGFTVWVP